MPYGHRPLTAFGADDRRPIIRSSRSSSRTAEHPGGTVGGRALMVSANFTD